MVQTTSQVVLSAFWNSKGVIHNEYLEIGITINSIHYIIETLKSLKKRINRVEPNLTQLLLHHDNTKPHCSRAKMEAI